MTRAFRFGVVHSDPPGNRVWTDVVRQHESLGFDCLLMTDHLDGQFAIGPAMAIASTVSPTMTFGSLVSCADFYNPVLLAREAATLDRLSGGRFVLGLGAGWSAGDFRRAGVRFDRPGARIERLSDTVDIIRACLRGKPFTFTSRHFDIDADVSPVPPPASPAGPPLLVGGGGERLLRMAGAKADIVSINPVQGGGDQRTSMFGPPDDDAGTSRKLTWLAEGAGHRFDAIELCVSSYVTMVVPDRDRLARALARRAGTDVEYVLTSPHVLIGTPGQIIDTLRERRDRWGLSFVVVDELQARALAPVIAELAGT